MLWQFLKPHFANEEPQAQTGDTLSRSWRCLPKGGQSADLPGPSLPLTGWTVLSRIIHSSMRESIPTRLIRSRIWNQAHTGFESQSVCSPYTSGVLQIIWARKFSLGQHCLKHHLMCSIPGSRPPNANKTLHLLWHLKISFTVPICTLLIFTEATEAQEIAYFWWFIDGIQPLGLQTQS